MGAHTPACLCAASDPVETVTPPTLNPDNFDGDRVWVRVRAKLARAAFPLYRDPGNSGGNSPPPDSGSKVSFSVRLAAGRVAKVLLAKKLRTESFRSITYSDLSPVSRPKGRGPVEVSQIHMPTYFCWPFSTGTHISQGLEPVSVRALNQAGLGWRVERLCAAGGAPLGFHCAPRECNWRQLPGRTPTLISVGSGLKVCASGLDLESRFPPVLS